jgi:hypothetical protein
MKRAFIRLEDFGPAPIYSGENLQKLQIIADYLYSEGVFYNISLIPRWVEPLINWDKSVSDTSDPEVAAFVDTVKYMAARGGIPGMHGYTHQYGNTRSGDGFEFYYPTCTSNCPPDDSAEASREYKAFTESYVYGRLFEGFSTFTALRSDVDWSFSPPHYSLSLNQRPLVEAWAGIIFEDIPGDRRKKTISIFDTDNAFYRGVVYIPTPLGYVSGSHPQQDVDRICAELDNYSGEDIAAFFYHLFLEFKFIQITPTGYTYDDNSYLKQLVRCFKAKGFTFARLDEMLTFSPSYRQTGLFPGNENVFFSGEVSGNGKDELIVWQPATGTWYFIISNLYFLPWRQNPPFSIVKALDNWAVGTSWQPLCGDYNGDGRCGVAVWDSSKGDWYVALSIGLNLVPKPGPGGDDRWLTNWGVGSQWKAFTGDFNGDGRDDLLTWDPTTGTWQVALCDGTKFVPAGTWLKPWARGSYWSAVVGDFNGDGKDDIAVWIPASGQWQVALSDGTRFVPAQGFFNNYIWTAHAWAVGSTWKPFADDFNGDGLCDLLVVNTTTGDWQVALSKGDWFEPVHLAFRPWAADPDMQPFVGDFNGDGRYDICARHPILRNGTLDFAMSVLGTGLARQE